LIFTKIFTGRAKKIEWCDATGHNHPSGTCPETPPLKPLHIKRGQGSKRRRRGVIIVSVATMGNDL